MATCSSIFPIDDCGPYGTCIEGLCVCHSGYSSRNDFVNLEGLMCTTNPTAVIILWTAMLLVAVVTVAVNLRYMLRVIRRILMTGHHMTDDSILSQTTAQHSAIERRASTGPSVAQPPLDKKVSMPTVGDHNVPRLSYQGLTEQPPAIAALKSYESGVHVIAIKGAVASPAARYSAWDSSSTTTPKQIEALTLGQRLKKLREVLGKPVFTSRVLAVAFSVFAVIVSSLHLSDDSIDNTITRHPVMTTFYVLMHCTSTFTNCKLNLLFYDLVQQVTGRKLQVDVSDQSRARPRQLFMAALAYEWAAGLALFAPLVLNDYSYELGVGITVFYYAGSVIFCVANLYIFGLHVLRPLRQLQRQLRDQPSSKQNATLLEFASRASDVAWAFCRLAAWLFCQEMTTCTLPILRASSIYTLPIMWIGILVSFHQSMEALKLARYEQQAEDEESQPEKEATSGTGRARGGSVQRPRLSSTKPDDVAPTVQPRLSASTVVIASSVVAPSPSLASATIADHGKPPHIRRASTFVGTNLVTMESVVEGNETFRAEPTAARPRRSTISVSAAASQVQPTIVGSGHHSRARSYIYGVPVGASRITYTAVDQPAALATSADMVHRPSSQDASAEQIVEDSAEEAAPAVELAGGVTETEVKLGSCEVLIVA